MWIAIILIFIAFIALRFLYDFNKDNHDLIDQNLSEKFNIVVDMLNKVAFKGDGDISFFNKRNFDLYKDGTNQLISFSYGTGSLTIVWRYKFFQKEVIHKKRFPNVRNLSIFEQEKMGMIMIEEMTGVIGNHQKQVLRYF